MKKQKKETKTFKSKTIKTHYRRTNKIFPRLIFQI